MINVIERTEEILAARHYSLTSGADAHHELFYILLPELLRLARLGLWAENHGIEAMEMGSFHHEVCPWLRGSDCNCANEKVKKAFAALPQEDRG